MVTWDKLAVLIGGLGAIAWVNWYFFLARKRAVVAAPAASGVQQVDITVEGGYSPAEIHVRAGQPVRLVFDRRETNPCSEEVVFPDFGIRRYLPDHQKTAIEFTPVGPGTYDFSCGMGMLHGKVVVE